MSLNQNNVTDQLRLYVWRGPQVLRNYRSGVVVVAASSIEFAWAKLRLDDVDAFYKLQYNCYSEDHFYFDFDENDKAEAIRNGFPLQPEIFDIKDFPSIVLHGGE